jgi:hypothetical protein
MELSRRALSLSNAFQYLVATLKRRDAASTFVIADRVVAIIQHVADALASKRNLNLSNKLSLFLHL